MKKLKKAAGMLLALALALVTLLGTGTAVRAEDTTGTATNSLTITNTGDTAHTFELYQIFTGDYDTVSKVLSNLQWGSGVTAEGRSNYESAAKKAESLIIQGDPVKSQEEANKFADELIQKKYLATSPMVSKKVDPSGSDTFNNLQAGYYLVIDKAGTQTNKPNGAYTAYILQVVGQAEAKTKIDVPKVFKKVKDINDSTGKESDWQDSADYDIGDDIPYQITGSMPSNIDMYSTYKYIFTDTMTKGLSYASGNAKIKIDGKDVTDSFRESIQKNDGSTVVTWSCENLKGISGVTLNKDSEVVVTYSCKLNEDAVIGAAGNPNTVNLTYSNNPNQGGEGDTGITPDDKNIVFTYKVVVNKVDQDKKALAGATFTLSKVNADSTTDKIKDFTFSANDEKNIFTASGLDDGTYVLKETTTPSGYNTIEDQYFTISADHDIKSDSPALKSLSGNKVDGTATTISFTPNLSEGSLTTDVVNKKGSSLPSTGGIGTTIFYVIGSVLVIGAGVLLVTRRRMNKKS